MVSNYAPYMRNLMGQTCTVEPYLGITGNQGRSYGTLRTYQCYVYAEYALIVNAAGQEIVATARTHIYPVATDGTPLAAIGVDDRLTLPDGKQPRIHSSNPQRDQFGRIILFAVYT